MLGSSCPNVSAASWCVVEGHTGRTLYGYKDLEIKEIASLTKIMTCYVCIKLVEDGLAELSNKVQVSSKSEGISGTSADLKSGDQLSIFDLLFALMLPSGNDAAWTLAEHFGRLLYPSSSKPVKGFISEMNKNARIMGLAITYFANPHGLIYKKNVSCARDVCKLSSLAMKNHTFRKIVATKAYSAEILGIEGKRRVFWENTNKLLYKGFDGIKTGVTDNAGPCLTVAFRGCMFVVVTLLNSRSMEARWEEAQMIVSWIMRSCN
jgi:D-alanyl-D-alanine carboxypeptidase